MWAKCCSNAQKPGPDTDDDGSLPDPSPDSHAASAFVISACPVARPLTCGVRWGRCAGAGVPRRRTQAAYGYFVRPKPHQN